MRPTQLVLFLLLVVTGIPLSGCGPEETDESFREQVIATVAGEDITVRRFEESYTWYLIQSGNNDTEFNRFVHLENMVDSYLLAAEARRLGFDQDSLFQIYLKRETDKALGARYYETALLEQLPDVTDAEIAEAFQKASEERQVRHLFFSDPEQANAVYARLQNGEDFVDLANDVFATSVYDSTAGNLGNVRYFNLDDAIAETVFSLPYLGVSEPVRSRFGYHILRVERIISNPLLTENQFQTQRQGLTQKMRLRKRRVEGDAFIRGVMEGLQVEVNSNAILQLDGVMKSLRRETPQYTFSDSDVQELATSFDPEKELLTYTWNGEARSFSGADYFYWLEELPPGEVMQRLAASVGRALRNEVLALEGRDQGLESDAWVQEEVNYLGTFRLASMYRESLRADNARTLSAEEKQRTAERLLETQPLKTVRVTFERIRFADQQKMNTAATDLAANPEKAKSYPGYEMHNQVDANQFADVRTALLGAAVGAAAPWIGPDGSAAWIRVLERKTETATLDDLGPEWESRLAGLLNEAETIQRLRESGGVMVDSTLFRKIMELN